MCTNITGYLPAEGFLGRTRVFELNSRVSSKEKLSPQKEAPAGGEVEGLNAYKVAVLLAVGATILSVL
jgi:hypothetical protein